MSVSSVPNGLPYDTTCILKPEEHSFIKHDSYILYAKARIAEADALLRGIKSGTLIPKEIMDAAIVDRICEGLQNSPHTAPKILRFYKSSTGG